MKTTLANSLILLLVASGTALISFIEVTSTGLAPVEALFLVFVAAIIAIQVVPALLLFAGMLKVLFARPQKRSEF